MSARDAAWSTERSPRRCQRLDDDREELLGREGFVG